MTKDRSDKFQADMLALLEKYDNPPAIIIANISVDDETEAVVGTIRGQLKGGDIMANSYVKPLEETEWRPSVFNAKIVERFLTGKDLKKFLESYEQNKRMNGGGSRFAILKREIKKSELDLLSWYVDENETIRAKEKAKEMGLSPETMRARIFTIAMRMVYQNSKKLGL